jgi:cytochrome c-type biogenesis protein CcmE
VARKRSPARLVIALSVAMLLTVFLLYTSISGDATAQVTPSELASHRGVVSLTGMVVGKPAGDAHGSGLRFAVRDIEGGSKTVSVLYRGSVPDLLKTDAHVTVQGQLRDGVFVAKPGTLITKCPSKYAPATQSPARAVGPAEGVWGNREAPPAGLS